MNWEVFGWYCYAAMIFLFLAMVFVASPFWDMLQDLLDILQDLRKRPPDQPN